ncbi:penicillin-binding transpeptidase domain-containing protein [uncultured Ruminococcus sp.]|uniref:penicillin-binding transpeptidase domain-containing protein n=1 Tax=uncultured Ruminococcus sp. TaxID=165186 RepID=UPI00261BD56A|nr:penicillin-binding transpeptidase domain-containing protein [uncultured Ruminococcus sp.]
MKGFAENLKSILIILLVVVLALLSSLRLMKIQVVGDKEIKAPQLYEPGTLTYTKGIKATRGEIMDYAGNLLVTNDSRTDLVLRMAFFPTDLQEGNRALLGIYRALEERGIKFKESIPISFNKPYVFKSEDTEELISDLNLNIYATADNCIDKLISDYEISDKYTDEEKRIIAGMRYQMIDKDFSYSNDLLLAEGVDEQTVIDMKELGNFYRGIEAIDASERRVVRGDILPHEIGTVGPIYAEEYDELKTKGYSYNDTLGKSGIEKAMETPLRGINGEEQIAVKDGVVRDIRTITEATSGETVKLTVDGSFQLKLQGILDNFLTNTFPALNPKPWVLKGNCGAICVLDAKTGAVKGMATAPTYNLKDYVENYEYFLQAKDSPLVNRCTYGLYRPGSTFKTITATAGLNEGVVTGGTPLVCNQGYDFYGTHYSCTGYHGNITMRRAIEVSCNSYFYEVSRMLGIDNITKYAKLYGLGASTGIETGDAPGYLCNPETFAEHGQEWYIGYVIQAGIGNQDCGMTPIQMATVANTIANRGIRYQPYLVDSYYDYGTGSLIRKTEPTIAQQIELNTPDLYDYIVGGMMDAAKNMPAKYSLSDLGFDVAIKTGTPQTGKVLDEQNSFFIGFAPANNPEIAFAGVIESGEYSKYMIRDILLAYQECYGLNGVKPTKQKLPEEVRHELVTSTTTESTITTTTTTEAIVTTEAPYVPETEAPYEQPQQPQQQPWTEYPAAVPTEPTTAYDPNGYAPEASQEPDYN